MAESFDLGSASIRVGIDNTGVVQGTQRTGQLLQSGFQQAVTQTNAALGGAGGRGGANGVQIPVGVNPNVGPGMAQAQQQIASQAQQISQQNRINIQIRADANQAVQSFNQVITAANTARRIGDLRLNVFAEVKDLKDLDNARRAIDNLRKDDRFTLHVDADASRANATLNALDARLQAASQRGARIQVNVETRDASGILGSLGSGAARGLIRGAGFGEGFLFTAGAGAAAIAGLGVATAVAQITRAMIEGVQTGIQYNANLEQQRNILEHYVGSAQRAEAALTRFRQVANIAGLPTEQVQAAGAQFTRISAGDVERAQELLRLTAALAAAHPELGFQSMQLAIQQLISGDFRAFEDRTNTAFGTVNRLVAQGKVGIDLYREAVKAAGGDTELLAKNAGTFQAQSATLGSNLQRLAGAATQPIFEPLTQAITNINRLFEEAGPKVDQYGRAVGEQLVGALKAAIPPFAGLASAIEAVNQVASRLPAAAPRQQLSQAFIPPTRQEVIEGQIARQKIDLRDIEVQLSRNAAAAAQIAAVYGTQIPPLERQIALLTQTNYLLERRQLENARTQVRIDERSRIAQGPADTRADIAASNVTLNAQREALTIQQQRFELTQRIADAEADVARRAEETSLRAAEQQVRLMQERASAAAEARRDSLDALRDQVQAEQEARRTALDNLRDQVQAQQQARNDEISGLREVAQLNQQVRQENIALIRQEADERRYSVQVELDGLREIARAREEAYREFRYNEDTAHQAVMDNFARQIDALRAKQQQTRDTGRTAAEEALREFDIRERLYEREKAIQDARNAVLSATSLSGQLSALSRLAEANREARVERERIALQERVDRERQQREQRNQQVQQQIAALEARAREADRQYQEQKRAEDHAFQQQQRADQEAIREAEKAERAAQQAEDIRIREQERADRQAAAAEQAAIRAAEQADREATRAENAQIREQERADRAADVAARQQLVEAERAARAADRADQEAIRAAEREIANRRQELADAEARRQDEVAQKRLDLLKQLQPIEEDLLNNQSRLLALQDIAAQAQIARDKLLADDEARMLDNVARLEDINGKLATQQLRENIDHINEVIRGLEIPLQNNTKQLEAQQAAAKATVESLERQKELLGPEKPFVPGSEDFFQGGQQQQPKPPIDLLSLILNPVGTIEAAVADFAGQVVSGVVQGIQQRFSQDPNAEGVFVSFINDAIAVAEGPRGLDIGSPSHKAERWADSVVEGLVTQLAARQEDVTNAFAALFQLDNISSAIDDSMDAIADRLADDQNGIGGAISSPSVLASVQQALQEVFPPAGQASALGLILDAWLIGIDFKLAADLPQHINSVGAHFGLQLGLLGLFPPAGQAVEFGDILDNWLLGIDLKLASDLEGHIDNDAAEIAVQNGVTAWFLDANLGNVFDQIGENFEVYGRNLATDLANGFISQMSVNNRAMGSAVTIPSGGGGGGGNTYVYSGGGATPVPQQPLQPGPEDITNYLIGKGYVPGTQGFYDEWDTIAWYLNNGYSPPPDMRVTGRLWGGPMHARGLYLAGESGPEIIDMGADNGRAYTADQLRSLLSGSGSGTTVGNIGPINVTVNGANRDANELAREIGPAIIRDMVTRLDRAQRTAPVPVTRAIPGAL